MPGTVRIRPLRTSPLIFVSASGLTAGVNAVDIAPLFLLHTLRARN